MSKYAEFFLVGKPEYTEITSKLRLRKFGSWLVEEVWAKEKQSSEQAAFSLKTIHLARKIAAAKGMEVEEAFGLLQGGDSEDSQVFIEFADEVQEVMSAVPSQRANTEELVTLFFKNRGEVSVGKRWERTDDWTVDDTRFLPQELMSAVEFFMVQESGEALPEDEEEDSDPKPEA